MSEITPPTTPQAPSTSPQLYAAEAWQAARELRGALSAAGITLPDLTVNPSRQPTSPKQLIDLGSIRPHLACMLAAVIRKGSAPTPTSRHPTLSELAQRAENLAAEIHHHLSAGRDQ